MAEVAVLVVERGAAAVVWLDADGVGADCGAGGGWPLRGYFIGQNGRNSLSRSERRGDWVVSGTGGAARFGGDRPVGLVCTEGGLAPDFGVGRGGGCSAD